MMTKSSPTNGVKDRYVAISPPAIAVMPLPSPKAIAVRAVDVDAHVGGRRRVVRRCAQRLAEAGVFQQQIEPERDGHRDEGRDRARLVEKHRGVGDHRPEFPGARRERRPHRLRRGAEHDQTAVLQDERQAKRDDELAEMPLVERARGAQAGDARDEEFVQQGAADEQHRPGGEGGDERPDIGSEERQHAPAAEQVQRDVHAEHQQLALREIHHLHDAEDQAKPDAHEPVDATDGDARGERVQHVLDQDLRVTHAAASGVAAPYPAARPCSDAARFAPSPSAPALSADAASFVGTSYRLPEQARPASLDDARAASLRFALDARSCNRRDDRPGARARCVLRPVSHALKRQDDRQPSRRRTRRRSSIGSKPAPSGSRRRVAMA